MIDLTSYAKQGEMDFFTIQVLNPTQNSGWAIYVALFRQECIVSVRRVGGAGSGWGRGSVRGGGCGVERDGSRVISTPDRRLAEHAQSDLARDSSERNTAMQKRG